MFQSAVRRVADRQLISSRHAADEMEAFEVSKDVGNVKNNSPELLNSR
ncbi:hypothetical protein [Edaphobacter aggregans]|nr:hypothetical protein [Edaphobacter aggregans]